MLDQESVELIQNYLSQALGHPIQDPKDLASVSGRKLLEILDETHDHGLPFIVQYFKEYGAQSHIFEKLMGDHDPELLELSNSFFNRYHALIEAEMEEEEVNPLLVYLPREYWKDLAFLQSRELFFKRQTIQCVQEFLELHFENCPHFGPIDQDVAWNWFFNQAMLE